MYDVTCKAFIFDNDEEKVSEETGEESSDDSGDESLQRTDRALLLMCSPKRW